MLFTKRVIIYDSNKANMWVCMSPHCVSPLRAGCQLDSIFWQEVSERGGGFGGSGRFLSPRRRLFEQVLAGVKKVGDNPRCPFFLPDSMSGCC